MATTTGFVSVVALLIGLRGAWSLVRGNMSLWPTKVSRLSTLPIEIITHGIFPKLPVKSLLRFKCVSKYYNSLISSPEYIELHLRQSLSSDTNRLLILSSKDNTHLYSIDVDLLYSTASELPLPLTFEQFEEYDDEGLPYDDERHDTISFVGSCNGLLCIELSWDTLWPGYFFEFKHLLINPSTRMYREVPDKEMPTNVAGELRLSFGFGFDDINNDYKLVRLVESRYDPSVGDELYCREVMVYSFKQNEWKLVEDVGLPTHSLQLDQNGVLMYNHLLHWLFRSSDDGRYHVYCFDVRSDKWMNNVPLMDLYNDRMAEFDNLGVLDGCLCLSTHTISSDSVWIMKEYGVKDSWVHLFDIRHCFGPGRCYFRGPYGFRQGKQHEVLVQESGSCGLFWCDMDIRSQSYSRTEKIRGLPAVERACFFKGSLVPVPRGEAYSVSRW